MKHIFEYLDETFKEMFEERLAIREFDGNQSRDEAERNAMAEVRRKVDQDKVQKSCAMTCGKSGRSGGKCE